MGANRLDRISDVVNADLEVSFEERNNDRVLVREEFVDRRDVDP